MRRSLYIVGTMRARYAPYPVHGASTMRRPAGSRDVLALCDTVEQLLMILGEVQHILPAEQQNEVELRVAALDRK